MKAKHPIFALFISCVMMLVSCDPGGDHLKSAIEKHKKGDLDGALEDYNRAITIMPRHAFAYANRGKVKMDKGDSAGAIGDYDRAIELNPKLDWAYRWRGWARLQNGDLKGALADHNRVIEFAPSDEVAYLNRGITKQIDGDLEGALADFDQAIELKPDFAFAFASRALANEAKDNVAGAMADFDRSIELDPENGRLHTGRGALLFMRQDWPGALAAFRRACELREKEQDYLRFFIWLVRAQMGEQKGADEELAAYMDRGREGKADDWAAKVGGFLLGRINEADFLAAAASQDPKKDREQHCEAWFYVGKKRLQAGDSGTAVDYFKKCLSTEKKTFFEYRFAKAELKALGRKE